MTAPFDIFQKETDGSVLWLGSAKSLEEARARAHALAARSLRDHVILNHQTGNKLVIPGGGEDSTKELKELRLPAWKKTCLEALREADEHRMRAKVAAAEAAIMQRLRELNLMPDDNPEKIALQDAARALAAIKDQKAELLDWKTTAME